MSSKVKKAEPAPIEKLDAWKVAQQQLRNVAELIQLDPIHEVSDRGWPYTAPSA